MTRLALAYLDEIQDAANATISSPTSFSSGAPLSNLRTRNLGVKAVSTDLFGYIDVSFGNAVSISFAAILGHNIAVGAYLDIELYDAVDALIVTSGQSWIPPSDSQFSRNAYFFFDQVYGAQKIRFRGHGIGGAEVQIGRLWCGTYWTPEEVEGVSRDEFDPRIADDNSTLNKSRGGQNFADVAARFRVHTMRLPYLTEADAIGTEDGETKNLQDIASQVGKTQPVIVIPSLANNQVIHKFGLYGTFEEPPSPRLIPESSERHYESTFTVIEEL